MIPGLSRNAVVAASAGTGKTELLTSIYLGHCLGLHGGAPLSPSRIVATTFSRAAAREIRERLEHRFAGVAGDDEAEYGRRLGEDLSALATERGVAKPELQRRAARALEELPDAAIDTLHNLCARVLREHGLELGIVPSFTILEEQRSLEETEQTIAEVLGDALDGSGLSALGAQQLLDASGGLDRLRNWMIGLLSRLDDEGLDAGELELSDEGAAALQQLQTLTRVCHDVASDPDSARAPLARAVLDALPRGSEPFNADRVSDAFVALAAERKGAKAAGAEGLKALLEQASSGTRTEQARALVRFIAEGPSLQERLRGVAHVLGEIQTRLRARHRAERSLGFGDLLRLTRDGLRDHPQVARAAGSRIELLLVDEFQDTSRVQCDLLLLLRERADANAARQPGHLPRAADLQPRGLVVVGDRKQSIYGFRGADVSVFAELATALAGDEAARLLDLPASAAAREPGPAVAEVSTLVDSYRSDRAVIDAVNLIATRDFVAPNDQSYEIRYAPAEALCVPAGRREVGDGAFTLLLDDQKTPEAEPFVMEATGPMRSALAVAGYCAQAVAAGRPLSSLAILARKRATLPLLGFALDHFGVPFVVAGRDLYGTQEVRDVFAALRLSQAPRERHALACIARGPLGGLSDQALVELSDPKRGLLPLQDWQPERLSRPEDIELASTLKLRLEAFLRVAPRLSPRDAIHDVVERFRLASVLSLLPRGPVRFANIGRFQEIAASHGGNLAAFVRFVARQIEWEFDETEAALFSADDDAVRLLTIHGSKGLAFPTVILADADAIEQPGWAPVAILRRSHARPLLVVRHAGEDGPIVTDTQRALTEDSKARAQAERQRLSYVALTRAKHEVVIALPAKPRSGTLAKTVLDLQTEGAFTGLVGYGELAVSELLAAPPLTPTESAPGSSPPALPAELETSAVVLGVTALSDFQLCPRRFSLLQLQGLSEPRHGKAPSAEDDADPRLAGIAAHRVLELWPLEKWGEPPDSAALAASLAESGIEPASPTGQKTLAGLASFLAGPYAALVRREAVRVERERALTITLTGRASRRAAAAGQLALFGGPQAPPLVVKATLDLLVELKDGSLHVVDYKRTRGGARAQARYEPQLALYRSAVAAQLGRVPRVGLLHLLGDASEPEWLDPGELDIAALSRGFSAARASDRWPHVARPVCEAVRCGFLESCHFGGNG